MLCLTRHNCKIFCCDMAIMMLSIIIAITSLVIYKNNYIYYKIIFMIESYLPNYVINILLLLRDLIIISYIADLIKNNCCGCIYRNDNKKPRIYVDYGDEIIDNEQVNNDPENDIENDIENPEDDNELEEDFYEIIYESDNEIRNN